MLLTRQYKQENLSIHIKGDYVIRGIHGEFYPCKSDIFDETYELVTVD